jgi:hypothetical protein
MQRYPRMGNPVVINLAGLGAQPGWTLGQMPRSFEEFLSSGLIFEQDTVLSRGETLIRPQYRCGCLIAIEPHPTGAEHCAGVRTEFRGYHHVGRFRICVKLCIHFYAVFLKEIIYVQIKIRIADKSPGKTGER